MYICICKAVTDSQIQTAINDGINTRKALHQCLGIGSDCGKCNRHVRELVNKNNVPTGAIQAII
ncbi:MAG: (2Fe-2S)-binding protein [Methyloprofundus sp.]|nr:(2Fe-2S)-binding protein [Methyloprofundus sp.]MBW6453690.1 (2Fe-2S)-binding protein [Methyloprofundus sp.]MDF1584200.1 (2Fe-2S)-binding protein [Methyloprofundus sp.]MDT8425166.1 (2Fe-2S)-binding protein [Methyloprofundus sp.]